MADKHKTKNDKAWEELFGKYNILQTIQEDGVFTIHSAQINEFREARLMTKFDHKSNLPLLFAENNLSILPITRGSYLISHFDAYQELTSNDHIVRIDFPEYIESLDYENITSEAAAINCAYISGILADFTEDVDLLPTVNGRMSSNTFTFDINNLLMGNLVGIEVTNSQIEIDGGYEGIHSLTLIEAKNAISDNFLIRQLYYPFRTWSNNIAKPVKTVFLIYTNGIFSLYEYEFTNPNHYNSLALVKQKNYSIESDDIELQDIEQILNTVTIVSEPKVAFPQADSFKRVINLCEVLYEKTELTREDITYNYDFDRRQTSYYTDAGRYLGLIDKKRDDGAICYFLTDAGNTLFKLKYKTRQLKFVELILQHRVFHRCLKRYLEHTQKPPKVEIVEIMETSNVYNIKSDSTFERRASTVSAWIDWILDLQS